MFKRRFVMHILVADPSGFHRRVMREHLMPAGMAAITEAESAFQAVSCLQCEPFDMLIADWALLTQNEGALLALVAHRARRSQHKMPVLALMTRPNQSHVLHAVNNGVDMVLCKPYAPKDLRVRVDWMLAKAAEATEAA
jgi:DNA-binding response OmpR family regulator